MQFIIGLIIGLILGAALGYVLLALFLAGHDDTEKIPARLLTPGAQVVYDGEVWEIERFDITTDGQTLAVLTNGVENTVAPVEEVR